MIPRYLYSQPPPPYFESRPSIFFFFFFFLLLLLLSFGLLYTLAGPAIQCLSTAAHCWHGVLSLPTCRGV